MGILRDKNRPSSTATSPCAHLRTAYHNCFNRWYSDKFLKGQWDKMECVSEWEKYRECLSKHLDDKHLSRFLDADGVMDFNNPSGLLLWILISALLCISRSTRKSKNSSMTNSCGL